MELRVWLESSPRKLLVCDSAEGAVDLASRLGAGLFPASSDRWEQHVLDADALQEGCRLLAELQIEYTWVSIPLPRLPVKHPSSQKLQGTWLRLWPGAFFLFNYGPTKKKGRHQAFGFLWDHWLIFSLFTLICINFQISPIILKTELAHQVFFSHGWFNCVRYLSSWLPSCVEISADHRKMSNKCEMRALSGREHVSGKSELAVGAIAVLTGAPTRAASNTVTPFSLFLSWTHFLPVICDIFCTRSNEPLTLDCWVLLVYSCFPRTPRQEGKLNVW